MFAASRAQSSFESCMMHRLSIQRYLILSARQTEMASQYVLGRSLYGILSLRLKRVDVVAWYLICDMEPQQ